MTYLRRSLKPRQCEVLHIYSNCSGSSHGVQFVCPSRLMLRAGGDGTTAPLTLIVRAVAGGAEFTNKQPAHRRANKAGAARDQHSQRGSAAPCLLFLQRSYW